MCFGVPPAPVYKGGGEEAAGLEGGAMGGNRIGLQVLFGPLPFLRRGKGEGRGKRRRKGGRAPPLVQFGLPMGGGAATHYGLPPLSPMAHVGPILPRGVPVTSRYS